MRYEILSDNSVPSDDGENATQYLFLEVPFENEKPVSEEAINNYCRDHFERRVTSPYDCSGQWFTSYIRAKIVENCDYDERSLVAVIIPWGRDV